jgi:bifunctional non-homologous end joining protein LigD
MLVREPFHRPGWVYEEKVDGWRMLAYKDGERVRLVSRHGVEHTRRFREIAAAVSKLSARTLVLDGEVAIFDQQLRSRFDWLRDPDPDAVATPPLLMAFDVLYCAGRDLTQRPLRKRRLRLEELVAGSERLFPVRRLAANGLEAWEQVLAAGYEGLVAKDEASTYEAGRTRFWLKVKQPGWTLSEDRWQRRIAGPTVPLKKVRFTRWRHRRCALQQPGQRNSRLRSRCCHDAMTSSFTSSHPKT